MIEFFECNVPNLRHALAVSGVGNEDIRSLAMLLIDLLEHCLYLFCGGNVHLMG